MNIYSRKQRWKLILSLIALVIVSLSIWYSNYIVDQISKEEKQKVKLWAEAIKSKAELVNYTNSLFGDITVEERKRIEIWAKATRRIAYTNDDDDRNFYIELISSNTTIPVIAVGEGEKIFTHRNLMLTPEQEKDTSLLRSLLNQMKDKYPPIEIETYGGKKQKLYYNDSKIFSDLKNVIENLISSFISEVVINSASVPVIFTDSSGSNILEYGNIEPKDTSSLPIILEEMKLENDPILVDLNNEHQHQIFYKNSVILTRLKYFPYIQFAVIALFLLISYYLFSTSRNAEQNQVWVGMAKETAHQLGTPLSSLIAWKEYLATKDINLDKKIIVEIGKDLNRLETITERFSKIGSVPNLKPEDIFAAVNESVNYLKSRVSNNVVFDVIPPKDELRVGLNSSLFGWVLENLIKNAVDAMEGKGKITIHFVDQVQYVYIDISDTGKGIPQNKIKTVFEPGFTTKDRGWGLGLSLAKRIIENYHQGKIFVKHSEPGKGTTFRIVLKK